MKQLSYLFTVDSFIEIKKNKIFKYFKRMDIVELRKKIHIFEEWFVDYMTTGQEPEIPLLANTKRPVASWPLVPLEQCLIVVLLYCGVIAWGFVKFKLCKKKETKLPDGEIGNTLYMCKFVYNFMQIFICSYMCIECVMLTYRHKYYLLSLTPSQCNKFNMQYPKMANLLWIFYLSKIFDCIDTVFIILHNKVKKKIMF
ncbi:putative microsomal very long chain fatty acid elongase [Reticulomyxa filosa]|uniref:Elongation of fatty acids protein n=1 Tax=Reticulomyxa filosa TaxID=46433 RepID=X6M6E3_RETFI|nr:putative microsomal very long chain fatty acid elongase [Reticulomyxa filosa]|eukprot:ETO09469.1 putative microsomal very long chain fatty acid elongase [Reticulomyxa filosa]